MRRKVKFTNFIGDTRKFIRNAVLLFITLSILQFVAIKKVVLLNSAARAIIFALLIRTLEIIYHKTRHLIPYSWLVAALLISLTLNALSAEKPLSTIKWLDAALGVEGLVAKISYYAESIGRPLIVKEPEPLIGPGETLVRYKTPQEVLAEKVLEYRSKQYILERKIHEAVNRIREDFGLQPLAWDERLAEIARYHSRDMGERNYFDHVSPEGETLQDRYRKFGYDCRIVVGNLIYSGGENLLQTYIYSSYYYNPVTGEITSYNFQTIDEIANSTAYGWLASEGHRKNLLAEFFTKEGIGVYITDNGTVFITQNFC